jgi:UDP-N-acetylmuramoyl-tripeptide--D-alanyl-D-alanine ligase
MYFALKGERFDGNQFALEALQKGCIAAVVDDPTITGEGILHVPDGLEALQSLASAHRRRFKGPVFGLTGSNGKTTTKELIKAVLERHLVVHATRGNLNNHIGVPLTLLAMPLDAEFALVEMGANHQGEIAALCRIAEPTLGMITNVGLAHLEGFGGVEGVKKGKQELYRYLAAHDGIAFVPAADSDLLALSELTGLERQCYGTSHHPPHAWRMDESVNAPLFWNRSTGMEPGPWHRAMGPLRVQLPGAHQLANMQAAIAVGLYMGVAPEEINVALASFLPVDQRGETVNTDRNRIIVDCYNANPSSVVSTLRAFAAAAHPSPLAILGDMKELGDHAEEGHQWVRDVARECGLECWVVGSDFNRYAPADRSYADMGTLEAALETEAIQNRTILLKGSRSMRMEALVQVL